MNHAGGSLCSASSFAANAALSSALPPLPVEPALAASMSAASLMASVRLLPSAVSSLPGRNLGGEGERSLGPAAKGLKGCTQVGMRGLQPARRLDVFHSN